MKPYSLAWYDRHQGPLGAQTVRGFDTMFEATSFMQALLQEDESIEMVVLKRRRVFP